MNRAGKNLGFRKMIICFTAALRCWSIHFTLSMIFNLNVQENNGDV